MDRKGEGAWTLFKLIGFIGFIKLIGVETIEAGRMQSREAINEKGKAKDTRQKAQGVKRRNGLKDF